MASPDKITGGVKSEAESTAVLVRFEAEHRLFEFSVRGISVWRLLRFPVGLTLQNLPFVRPSLPRVELLAACLRSLRDLFRLPDGTRYIVKTFVSALRIQGQRGYEDIYFERLLDEVPGGVRMYSINAPGFFRRPVNSLAPAIDCTLIIVAGALLARLLPVREGDAVFTKLTALLEAHLGIMGLPAKEIRRMFSSYWWQSHLYEKLLRRLGPQTVFAADTGERALLGACQRLGTRFVELQHGIFTPDHPDSLPFSALQGIDEATLLLPDTVALYGEYWFDRQADSALGKSGRLLSAGASVIENFRAMRATNFRSSPKCPRLLVTTQGIDRDALIEFLSRFLSKFRGQCLLTVKLHPAYDSSPKPYAIMLGADPRARIVGGHDDPNTYELIVESDLHMSIASACHYDALGIGTPTLVIGLAGYQLMEDILVAGDALFASNPEELVEIVSRHTWEPVTAAVSGKYYRNGFVQNLLPLIK